MLLTIGERILLTGVLPSARDGFTGDFTTLKTIRDLQTALWPSGEEVEKFGIVQDEREIRWNPEVDTAVEIPISDFSLNYLKKLLMQLNDKEALHFEMIDLYARLVGEEAIPAPAATSEGPS